MTHIKEPVNALTHLLGILLSVVGSVFMIADSIMNNSGLQLAGAIVFGISLICLYTASTVYHWVRATDKIQLILRKIDHTMIYVLIAGTYTPVCLITLNGVTGWGLLTLIWSLAIAGIITKLLWLDAPRWLYTSIYLILGWMVIFFAIPIFRSLPLGGSIWLLTGGILYTLGAVIYATKPKWMEFSIFGFHEIFHIFIILGSVSHYIMTIKYIFV